MPPRTHQPAYSTQDLVLLFMRPKSSAMLADTISLASATTVLNAPMSIIILSISYHTHNMKLEFSPPYDFSCDLCQKPSYHGWLYRCSMCEFDTHLSCAIQYLEPKSVEEYPSFSKSTTLFWQITSTQLASTKFNGSIYIGQTDIAIGYELVHLVSQKIDGGNITDRKALQNYHSTVSGWDKRLYSPKRNNTAKIVELQGTEACPVGNSTDKLTQHSDLVSESYHFGEALFSIDLTRHYDPKSQATKQVGNLEVTRSVAGYGITSKPMPQRMLVDSGQANQQFDLYKWPSFDSFSVAQQNRMKEAFLNRQTTGDFGRSSSQNRQQDTAVPVGGSSYLAASSVQTSVYSIKLFNFIGIGLLPLRRLKFTSSVHDI